MTTILLRIASVVMLLHDVGHTMGHLGWKRSSDANKQSVIKAMTDNKFPFMGASRSMGDYYDGYGYAATATLMLVAVILWLLSGVDISQTPLALNVLVALAVFLLAWVVIEARYFFPFATAFSLVALLLCIVTIVIGFRAARPDVVREALRALT